MRNVRLTLAGVAISGSLVAATVCIILLIGPVIAFDAWPARGSGAGGGKPLVISDVTPSGRALLGIGRFTLVRAPAARTSAAPVPRSAAVSSSAPPRVHGASHAPRRHAQRRTTRPATPSSARTPRSIGGGSEAPGSSAPPAGGAATGSPAPSGEGSPSGSTGGASPSAGTAGSSTPASDSTTTKGNGGKAKGNGTSSSTSTASSPVDTAGGTDGGGGTTTSSPVASSDQQTASSSPKDKGSNKKIPPGQAKKAERKAGDGG